MKIKLLLMALISIGGLSSCGKNETIVNLYEQPLSVIQKAVQGEWKLQYSEGGYAYRKIIDTLDSYMYISENHIIMGNAHGIYVDSPIIWMKGEPFGGDLSAYLLTYNHGIDITEQDGVILEEVPIYNTLVPYQIKNGTLAISDVCCDGYSYYYTKQ